MTAWCPSVAKMIEKLEDHSDATIQNIGYYGGDDGLRLERGGQKLIDSIREVNRPCVKEGLGLSFLYLHNWNGEWCREFERKLMEAWKSNKLITKVLFEWERKDLNYDMPGHGMVLAKGFEDCPHATGVGNRYATKSYILRVCTAALQKPTMESLEVTTNLMDRTFDDEELQALAMVKMKFPSCFVGGSRALNSTIASKAIINPMAEAAIRCHQRNVMEAFLNNDWDTAEQEFDVMKTGVADSEQDRLLQLLPLLCEKYCIVGGLELLQIIPEDFDNSDLEQLMPTQLGQCPAEDQVRFLLAIADYKREQLNELIFNLDKEMAELGRLVKANSKRIPQVVDDFFCNHGLAECFATLDAYKITVDHGRCANHRPVTGNYVQDGFANGNPYFYNKEAKIYHYYFTSNGISSWSFSGILSSNISNCNLPTETSGPRAGQKRPKPEIEEGDNEKWQTFNGCKTPHFEAYKWDKRVQDGVIEFFQNKSKHTQHLTLGEQLMEVHIGPSKGFDRALQKGAAWLRDLNRCTLVFDSPALMVLGFKLFDGKVKAIGGEMVRLTNLFFKNGTLNTEPRAPPCIHVNYAIEDYIYEVMFTLSNFYTAKERVHKFYDIARAKRPIEVAKPVFEPLPLDGREVFAEDSAERLLSQKIKKKSFTKSAGSAMNAVRNKVQMARSKSSLGKAKVVPEVETETSNTATMPASNADEEKKSGKSAACSIM
jgi:hypothetical protein